MHDDIYGLELLLKEQGISWRDLNNYISKRAVYLHNKCPHEPNIADFPRILRQHNGLVDICTAAAQSCLRTERKDSELKEKIKYSIMLKTAAATLSSAQFASLGCAG